MPVSKEMMNETLFRGNDVLYNMWTPNLRTVCKIRWGGNRMPYEVGHDMQAYLQIQYQFNLQMS